MRLFDPEEENMIRLSAYSIDEQRVPPEVVYCKRCVLSNQRPRTTFDEEGICSACRFMEHHHAIDWSARHKELEALCDKHRSGGKYDVIVPASGGKDSSCIATVLKHEFGMHPLCVKFAPFMYTDIGQKNWTALNMSGYDCIEFRPNGIIHRKLARIAFEYLGDAFQPFVFGQLAFPMHIAQQLGVDLVFGGENGEAFYGGDSSANDKRGWDPKDWDRIYLKNSGVQKLLDIGKKIGVISNTEYREASQFYRLPYADELPEYHWLSYYKHWKPQRNYYEASEHCGFEPNPERSEGTFSRYASLDDKLDGEHYFMAYRKFGIGRATSDAAHEVRDGDRDREEAMVLVKRYDGERPMKYHAEFLEYLGIDEEQYLRVVDRFTNKRLFDGDVLRGDVISARDAAL
jgi:N-acetyl sugar amidotransferase